MSLTRAPAAGVDVTRFQIRVTADAVGRVGVGDGSGLDEVVGDAAGLGVVVGDAVGDGIARSAGGRSTMAPATATMARAMSVIAIDSGVRRMARPSPAAGT
jgi:hypothetical protein